MAQTHIQPGDVLTLTAPSGGVVKGTAYQIGQIIGIALNTADAGASVEFATTGVWSVAKADSQQWTVGAVVYFDAGNNCFTTTAAGAQLAGVAVEAVAATGGLTTGKVRLNGSFRPDEAG